MMSSLENDFIKICESAIDKRKELNPHNEDRYVICTVPKGLSKKVENVVSYFKQKGYLVVYHYNRGRWFADSLMISWEQPEIKKTCVVM